MADSACAGWVDVMVGGVDSASVKEVPGYSAERVAAGCDDARGSVYSEAGVTDVVGP